MRPLTGGPDNDHAAEWFANIHSGEGTSSVPARYFLFQQVFLIYGLFCPDHPDEKVHLLGQLIESDHVAFPRYI
ncbi:MAG: hypothetical protein JXQ27_02100 [Acidobacteria bacterium]|nr:hypothetical protein [Acidobacteriota bacterium]